MPSILSTDETRGLAGVLGAAKDRLLGRSQGLGGVEAYKRDLKSLLQELGPNVPTEELMKQVGALRKVHNLDVMGGDLVATPRNRAGAPGQPADLGMVGGKTMPSGPPPAVFTEPRSASELARIEQTRKDTQSLPEVKWMQDPMQLTRVATGLPGKAYVRTGQRAPKDLDASFKEGRLVMIMDLPKAFQQKVEEASRASGEPMPLMWRVDDLTKQEREFLTVLQLEASKERDREEFAAIEATRDRLETSGTR